MKPREFSNRIVSCFRYKLLAEYILKQFYISFHKVCCYCRIQLVTSKYPVFCKGSEFHSLQKKTFTFNIGCFILRIIMVVCSAANGAPLSHACETNLIVLIVKTKHCQTAKYMHLKLC